jgi:hypothetical protein
MFRIVASVIVMICVLVAWIISDDSNITNVQSTGNTSPLNTEQVPVQPKPTNPGGKNFNF